MAHLKKFTKNYFKKISKHCLREEILKSEEENIDFLKSNQNYNLSNHGNSFVEVNDYFKKRLSELHLMRRADVKVSCSWAITAPKDLPNNLEREFFEASKEFLDKKYGAENNIFATVHYDEATPHMHYNFIPAVPDRKHGGFKVSAFELLNKTHLNTFHTEFEQFLKEKGIPCTVKSGITRLQGGNRTIPQLKAERPLERQQESRWERNNTEEYNLKLFFEE